MGANRIKKIALVGYPSNYFWNFAQGLENTGFQVYWICATKYEFQQLRNKGVHKDKLLNASFSKSENIKVGLIDQKKFLSEVEDSSFLTINNIISMDRILSKLNQDDSFAYISHIYEKIDLFLQKNEIKLIASGRDTALQLMSLIIANHRQIKWVVATRLRIPLNFYGFSETFETYPMLKFRNVTNDDYDWAEQFINDFRTGRSTKPALKVSARSFSDTFKLLKIHFLSFFDLIKRSIADRGNIYSRYTIMKIIKMYLSRRINMFFYMYSSLASKNINSSSFVIYPLHTQPESSIDVAGAFFSNQIELIRSISRCLPSNFDLVVKVHPTDIDGKRVSFYKEISKIPSVKIIDYSFDTKWLIDNARIIFTLAGTMGYEAAILGKPVITFARNYYNDLPGVFFCNSPYKLSQTILNALEFKKNESLLIEGIANLKSCVFDGEVNRNFGQNPTTLTDDDILKLQNVYNKIYDQLNNTND